MSAKPPPVAVWCGCAERRTGWKPLAWRRRRPRFPPIEPITLELKRMNQTNSRDTELRARAAAVIPGGMYGHQSVAMAPDGYPQFFSRADGARLWDADGKEYIDFMCAY